VSDHEVIKVVAGPKPQEECHRAHENSLNATDVGDEVQRVVSVSLDQSLVQVPLNREHNVSVSGVISSTTQLLQLEDRVIFSLCHSVEVYQQVLQLHLRSLDLKWVRQAYLSSNLDEGKTALVDD